MHIETQLIQEGYKPENGQARVLPIHQSTAYKYTSSEYMGQLFDLQAAGHIYTRMDNPTSECVENKIAALEGGVGALLTSSGQAAALLAITNICEAGDHVVSAAAIYGGTVNLFAVTLKKLGIEVTFVDADSPEEEIQKAFRENTKAVFGETLANPALRVLDIEKFAAIAHKNHVPLIVDNTFPTPYLCRPISYGADIVIHSTSKYMDGHAISLGGVIVDSGSFDWTGGKFPEFTQPDSSYHGVVYTEAFGKAAYIVKARVQMMRDMGATLSPFNAFLLNVGLETLHVRMDRHCSNAQKIAEYLEQSPYVAWVNYPGLPASPAYSMAQKYLPKGCAGVVSFGLKSGREGAVRFMDKLKVAAMSVHVADVRTCVLHPASTTHRQLNDEQLRAAGVGPELIRISVGIENADDLIADIEQALSY